MVTSFSLRMHLEARAQETPGETLSCSSVEVESSEAHCPLFRSRFNYWFPSDLEMLTQPFQPSLSMFRKQRQQFSQIIAVSYIRVLLKHSSHVQLKHSSYVQRTVLVLPLRKGCSEVMSRAKENLFFRNTHLEVNMKSVYHVLNMMLSASQRISKNGSVLQEFRNVIDFPLVKQQVRIKVLKSPCSYCVGEWASRCSLVIPR